MLLVPLKRAVTAGQYADFVALNFVNQAMLLSDAA